MTTNFTFTNTSQQALVTVSIVDDAFSEDSEILKVEIRLIGVKDGGCVLLQPNVVDINILDNDGEFRVLTEILLYMLTVTYNNIFTFCVIASSVAVIGFSHDNYLVTEGVDNSTTLTVELISGQLGREVIVNFGISYPSGTATSMSCMLLILMQCLSARGIKS